MSDRPAVEASYLQLPLADLLDEIASPDPAPGSGFSAAVAVGLGAALASMCARLSGGEWSDAEGVAAQAESLRARVTPLADLNVQAYLDAVAALRDPGDTGYSTRDEVIARALDRAAEIPLEIARAGADVAELAAAVAESGEPSLRADAAVAASLAVAGTRGAAALVEVNLGTTSEDERVVRARAFVEDASQAADRALAAVG
jgi:formiminotetrahydrofolate cyclodeaminase